MSDSIREVIFNLVDEERERQIEAGKPDNQPWANWLIIFVEYTGKLSKTLWNMAMNNEDASFDSAFMALLKVVSIGVAWLEDIVNGVELEIDTIVSKVYGDKKRKTKGN